MEVKKMNTGEAIEFCKSELYFDLKNFLPDYQLEYNNKMREVISLLQQGEADSKELKVIKEELKKVWQMLSSKNTSRRRRSNEYKQG